MLEPVSLQLLNCEFGASLEHGEHYIRVCITVLVKALLIRTAVGRGIVSLCKHRLRTLGFV